MAKGDNPTIKQKKFVAEYLKTGNGTQAALAVYDTDSPEVAGSIASDNLKKQKVKELIESHAEFAAHRVRQLAGQEDNLNVALTASRDILDRSGYAAPQIKPDAPNLFQINVYNTEQARRLADRVLQAGLPEGQG